MAIPLDKDSLLVMMQLSTKRGDGVTNRKMFDVMKEWFTPKQKENTNEVT
jgi:hypothetical protein